MMRTVVTAAVVAMALVAPAAAATTKDGVDAWQRGDYPQAVTIWRPLAEGGDADAQFNLAQAYKLGRGVPNDLGQAKEWYGKAAKGGHVQAAANYGLLLFQDGDRKEAMPYIQKASDAGDPRAQYVLGTALFNGDLLPKDWPRAYALMTRAAAAGLPQATTSLSQMDQFLSVSDRQKGLALASQMSSQPAPPTSRTIVASAGGSGTSGPITPRGAGTIQPVDVPASRPFTPYTPPATKAPPVAKTPPVAVAKAPAPPPAPKPAVKAPVAVASSGGGWKVQLGAYSSEGAAQTAWSGLSGKAAGLRGLQPSYEHAGAVVRLRAGGLADKAAAERACGAAKAAGAACFPVAP